MPETFKLDHLQPVKPLLFQNFSNFFTLLLGSQFLLPQIRVETEAPPAGDLRRRSGRSPGRGSLVGNLKPPAITETPVLAGAPDKTGDF